MDSDYLNGGYAHKKELENLEARLLMYKEELIDMNDSAHGRPHQQIENDIAEMEAKIRLFKTPTGE